MRRNLPASAFLIVTWIFLLTVGSASAQSATGDEKRSRGTITGRVVNEDGAPMPNVPVNIMGISTDLMTRNRQSVVTDDDGNFRAEKLDPGAYTINASAPGYVISADGMGDEQSQSPRYYRPGDAVTVRMVKGGVITGKVLNDSGVPVIGIPVIPVLVRDGLGQPARNTSFQTQRQTDDRGIYRIYGLPPGTYIVLAGGRDIYSGRQNPFAAKVPTFYPSATRDTATELTLRSGEEHSNIDIRYRGERGYSISGKLLGLPDQPRASGNVIIGTTVTLAQGENVISNTWVNPMSGGNGYALYGVPDGEYTVQASRGGGSGQEDILRSAPRRVTIRGGSITGVDLTLAPTAALAGTVQMESLPTEQRPPSCASPRPAYPEEIVLKAEQIGPQARKSQPGLFEEEPRNSPNDKGEFKLRGLDPGRYYLTALLPGEAWYLRAITRKSVAPAARAKPAKSATADVNAADISLKAGEKVSDVTMTIAEGAASLSGKVTAAAGMKLSARLLVHLIPADSAAKDDVIHYFEAEAAADGSFNFRHLPPGKWRLFAQEITEPYSFDNPKRPLAWDDKRRAKLWQTAETAGTLLELKPCVRVTAYSLTFPAK